MKRVMAIILIALSTAAWVQAMEQELRGVNEHLQHAKRVLIAMPALQADPEHRNPLDNGVLKQLEDDLPWVLSVHAPYNNGCDYVEQIIKTSDAERTRRAMGAAISLKLPDYSTDAVTKNLSYLCAAVQLKAHELRVLYTEKMVGLATSDASLNQLHKNTAEHAVLQANMADNIKQIIYRSMPHAWDERLSCVYTVKETDWNLSMHNAGEFLLMVK